MKDQPERVPINEVKDLVSQAIEDNMDLLQALVEYDLREQNRLPGNLHMPTISFTPKSIMNQVRIGFFGKDNEATATQVQQNLNVWITSIIPQPTTAFSRSSMMDVLSQSPQ